MRANYNVANLAAPVTPGGSRVAGSSPPQADLLMDNDARALAAAKQDLPRRGGVGPEAVFAHQRGRPEQPADLLTHPCIQFRYPGGRPHSWPFGQGDVQKELPGKGPIEVTDLDLVLDLALQGSGVGYVLREMAKAFIRKGELISVLEEWLPEQPGFYLYYSNRRHPSAAFRAFIDFLRENNKKASA